MWTVRNKDIIRNALVTVSVGGVRLSDVGVIHIIEFKGDLHIDPF